MRFIQPPSWHQFSILAKSPIFKSSAFVLVAVPMLARLSGSAPTEWPEALLRALDNPPAEIPLNLVRLFWASATFLAAQTVFAARCPPIIRSYSDPNDWKARSEVAHELIASQRRAQGAGANVDEALNLAYTKNFNSVNMQDSGARLMLSFLYAVGGVLVVRVLISQMWLVLQHTNIVQLLF